jgi:hypothetical protein
VIQKLGEMAHSSFDAKQGQQREKKERLILKIPATRQPRLIPIGSRVAGGRRCAATLGHADRPGGRSS